MLPNVVTLSEVLRLSDAVAGVTLLAMGNGAADIFTAATAGMCAFHYVHYVLIVLFITYLTVYPQWWGPGMVALWLSLAFWGLLFSCSRLMLACWPSTSSPLLSGFRYSVTEFTWSLHFFG